MHFVFSVVPSDNIRLLFIVFTEPEPGIINLISAKRVKKIETNAGVRTYAFALSDTHWSKRGAYGVRRLGVALAFKANLQR